VHDVAHGEGRAAVFGRGGELAPTGFNRELLDAHLETFA
jgi:hypothetical protein